MTIRTQLASETRRMCSTYGHQDRPATVRRVVRGARPVYVAFYGECAECAARKLKDAPGTKSERQPVTR